MDLKSLDVSAFKQLFKPRETASIIEMKKLKKLGGLDNFNTSKNMMILDNPLLNNHNNNNQVNTLTSPSLKSASGNGGNRGQISFAGN